MLNASLHQLTRQSLAQYAANLYARPVDVNLQQAVSPAERQSQRRMHGLGAMVSVEPSIDRDKTMP